jgi:hypothetical protein
MGQSYYLAAGGPAQPMNNVESPKGQCALGASGRAGYSRSICSFRITMDFFNSLSLDLKMLAVAIAGCALLAVFSGNPKTEKRYILVLALLAAGGVYRFNHTAGNDQAEARAAASIASQAVTPPPKHVPLVSTSAK